MSRRDEERLIWEAETEREFPERYDDPGGQDQYERYLDRLGEA